MGNEYRRHRRGHSEDSTDENNLAEPARRILNTALVQRLGEAEYGEATGRVGFLNLLAGSGALVPEGVMLTHEFHRRFLDAGGIAEAVRDSVDVRGDTRCRARALRRKYGKAPIDGELNRMVCDAIIGLGARTVVVISEDVTRSRLRSIPKPATPCEKPGSR